VVKRVPKIEKGLYFPSRPGLSRAGCGVGGGGVKAAARCPSRYYWSMERRYVSCVRCFHFCVDLAVPMYGVECISIGSWRGWGLL
jgi:hypothetical protein